MTNPIPLCVGIDPGSSSSPTGLAIIRMDTGALVHVTAVNGPKKGDWWSKLSFIEKTLKDDLHVAEMQFGGLGHIEKIFIEETQFRFRMANLTFQRMIGMYGLMAIRFLQNPEGLVLISPTTVKKWIGGHGGCEKPELAGKAAQYFQDRESRDTMRTLIEEEEWDVTDAVAIALCYRYVDEIKVAKKCAQQKRSAARKKKRIAMQAGIED